MQTICQLARPFAIRFLPWRCPAADIKNSAKTAWFWSWYCPAGQPRQNQGKSSQLGVKWSAVDDDAVKCVERTGERVYRIESASDGSAAQAGILNPAIGETQSAIRH